MNDIDFIVEEFSKRKFHGIEFNKVSIEVTNDYYNAITLELEIISDECKFVGSGVSYGKPHLAPNVNIFYENIYSNAISDLEDKLKIAATGWQVKAALNRLNEAKLSLDNEEIKQKAAKNFLKGKNL